MTEEIRTLAIERASADRIAEVAVRQGMRRLHEDGLEKVRQGRTSIAEVYRVTSSGSLADRTAFGRLSVTPQGAWPNVRSAGR